MSNKTLKICGTLPKKDLFLIDRLRFLTFIFKIITVLININLVLFFDELIQCENLPFVNLDLQNKINVAVSMMCVLKIIKYCLKSFVNTVIYDENRAILIYIQSNFHKLIQFFVFWKMLVRFMELRLCTIKSHLCSWAISLNNPSVTLESGENLKKLFKDIQGTLVNLFK